MRKTFLLVMLVAGSASVAHPVVAVPDSPVVTAKVICRIVGRRESIVVRAGANGPTYALENKSGETMVNSAGLNKLAMTHPQLAHSIVTMQADATLADLGD